MTFGEINGQGTNAIWRFNDNLNDSGSGGHTGTWQGGGSPVYTPGKFNSAVDLDGSHFVSVTDHADFDFTSALSIGFWVNLNSNTATKGILTKRINPGGDDYGAFINSADFIVFITWGLTQVVLSGVETLSNGQWYWVVCVYDGSDKYIYINGKEDAKVAATGSMDVTANTFIRIGHDHFSGNLDAKLDDVFISGVALSAAQIRTYYNSLKQNY